MERKLTLVVSNPSPKRKEEVYGPFVTALHLVPDSDLEIRATVKKFAMMLLERDEDGPVGYLQKRREFDNSTVVGAIRCLSPRAVDSLRANLMVIAELSLHPSIRHAALLKLAESELSQ